MLNLTLEYSNADAPCQLFIYIYEGKFLLLPTISQTLPTKGICWYWMNLRTHRSRFMELKIVNWLYAISII